MCHCGLPIEWNKINESNSMKKIGQDLWVGDRSKFTTGYVN